MALLKVKWENQEGVRFPCSGIKTKDKSPGTRTDFSKTQNFCRFPRVVIISIPFLFYLKTKRTLSLSSKEVESWGVYFPSPKSSVVLSMKNGRLPTQGEKGSPVPLALLQRENLRHLSQSKEKAMILSLYQAVNCLESLLKTQTVLSRVYDLVRWDSRMPFSQVPSWCWWRGFRDQTWTTTADLDWVLTEYQNHLGSLGKKKKGSPGALGQNLPIRISRIGIAGMCGFIS